MVITTELLKQRVAELETAVTSRRAAVEQALGALSECRAMLAFVEQEQVVTSPVEAISDKPVAAVS